MFCNSIKHILIAPLLFKGELEKKIGFDIFHSKPTADCEYDGVQFVFFSHKRSGFYR